MAATVTIPVGADGEAEYLAFGDDSQFGDTLAFAFVILQKKNLARAHDHLENLKELYRIPKETTLHCRVLFNGDERKRKNLSHLTERDAKSIVVRAVRIINRIPILVSYGRDSLSRLADSLGGHIEMTDHTDNSKITLPVTADPKGILALLMQACLTNLHDPAPSQCEIFVAEDRTRVRFVGPRRQRAHQMYQGYLDTGAPEGSIFQLQPKIVAAHEHPMLQLADIAAYICSHANDPSARGFFFRQELSRIKHWRSVGY